MDTYLRTDERIECIKSLEKTIQFLRETEEDIYQWKWCLISLHNCLQAFMVVALKGGNSLNVMRPKHAEKWLEAYDQNANYPYVKLDYFNELYEKIKSDLMNIYIHSRRFTSSESIDKSVQRLNDLRNRFIHFMPMGWSLGISGLPELALNIQEILEFLVFDSGNIYFNEEEQMRAVEEMVIELKCDLIQMKLKYDV